MSVQYSRDDIVDAIEVALNDPRIGRRRHFFAGVQICLKGRQLGHIHDDLRADLPFKQDLRQTLLRTGAATVHLNKRPGWVSKYVSSPDDLQDVIRLFELRRDELANRSQGHHKDGRPQGRMVRRAFMEAVNRIPIPGTGMVRRASLVPDGPFLDPRILGWTDALEGNAERIAGELASLLSSMDEIPAIEKISRRHSAFTPNQKWKTFFLYGRGERIEENCARCPETAALLGDIPDLLAACYSILLPGSYLEPHRGGWNGTLRYHLGLKIPESAELCGIRVGQETRHWHYGQSLLFDNSWVHSAWNDSDEVRVVLLIDVARPLREPYSKVNQLVLKTLWLDRQNIEHAIRSALRRPKPQSTSPNSRRSGPAGM